MSQKIRFYDNFVPRLPSGSYEVTVEQEVESNNPQVPIPGGSFKATQAFRVDGPRFTLAAADVLSVFPPPNSDADYSSSLPSITLTRRSLPWERRRVSGDESSIPWLALLLFDEGEIEPPAKDEEAGPTGSVTRPLADVVGYDRGGVLGPQLKLDPIPATRCRTIDVKAATLDAIVPAADELPYLAHCRQVDTAHQEMLAVEKDGWYAFVAGNRFPGIAKGGVAQLAHLVSLEGFDAYLKKNRPPSFPAGKTIRLVSLASWAFTSRDAGPDFTGLVKALNDNHSVSSLLRMPAAPPSSDAEKSFAMGYTALDYTTRQGEKTVGWYRGPFVPVLVPRDEKPPLETADAAKIYDKDTGLFDVSYAVAWQIGRLLALSDRTFAVHVSRWKRSGGRLLALLNARIALFEKYRGQLPPPERLDQVLDPAYISAAMKARFARKVAPRALTQTTDPSGLMRHLADLPGLLCPEQLDDLYARGEDPHAALHRLIFGE